MDVFLEAFYAPDPASSRPPIHTQPQSFAGADSLSANWMLIATAALAAREGDWPAAARLLAAASAGGGMFSTPPGVALYRVTVPKVRAALDKSTRETLITQGRALGLPAAIDLAATWLSKS